MSVSRKIPLVVRVLGSGTCVPLAKRFPSSYFVKQRYAARGWMLDLGTGALQRLAQAGESYKVLENVFISHVHPDHCASLIPLLQALSATPDFQRKQPLTVFGPQHVKDYLDLNLDFAPDLRPTFPFEFIVLSDSDERLHEEWQLNTRIMKHSVPTLALRLMLEGYSIVYGADTEPCEALIELAYNTDLLILEASFPQNQPSTGHMTTAQVGEVARIAKAKKLLVSHLYPAVSKMDDNKREAEVRASGYSGEIIFATDLMELSVS
jgi:ribonuclease BN (tRNA processing enzyme)